MTTTSPTGSATASLVTALGGGSGIDMQALASNLAVAQFAGRTDRLTARSETLERQISAASTLKSMMQNLASSLGDRVRVGDLSPQPQVANGGVARATLSGAPTTGGSYSLEVTALASGQVLASPAFAASTAPVGSGTLTIRFGAVSGTGFTANPDRAALDITVPSGATLTDVAGLVNAKRGGVTAYVANTTEGAKLVLKGPDGAINGFSVEATETAGEEGLAALAWTPAAPAGRLIATAADAALKIDGLATTSASNTLANVIPGVTLNLTATNTGAPTTITFANPATAITEAMRDLTAALNEVMAELNKATDPKSGDLARDSGAMAMKRSLSQLAASTVMPNAPAGAPRMLVDLGLSTQRDGTFALDERRLAATLAADPQNTAAMFTNGLFGVFATVDGLSRRFNRSSDPGTIAGSINRYTSQKAKVGEDLTKLAEQQEALRSRLSARFAVTDNQVGASKSTLSFLQNQIDAWNAQRN